MKTILSICMFIELSYLDPINKPVDACVQSQICNHTWIPVCGQNEKTSVRRLFGDLCDMLEYNCDFKSEYREINKEVCEYTTTIFARKSLLPPVINLSDTTTVPYMYDDNDYLTNIPGNVTTVSTYYLRSPDAQASAATLTNVISKGPVIHFLTQGLENRRQNTNRSPISNGLCTCGRSSSITATTQPLSTTTTIPTNLQPTSLPSSIRDRVCTCTLPRIIAMTTTPPITMTTRILTTTLVPTSTNARPTDSIYAGVACTCPESSQFTSTHATTYSTTTTNIPVPTTTANTTSIATLISPPTTSTVPIPDRACTCSTYNNTTSTTTRLTTTTTSTLTTTTTSRATTTTSRATTTTTSTNSTYDGVACTCSTQIISTNATTTFATTTTTNMPSSSTTLTSQPTTSTEPSSIPNKACTCSAPTNIETVKMTTTSTAPITSSTFPSTSTTSSSVIGEKACTCSTPDKTTTTTSTTTTTTAPITITNTTTGGKCTCSTPAIITTTNATTDATTPVQASSVRKACGNPGCDIAVSWATTVKGETRDYYQILRSKYGLPLRRRQLTRALRYATHYPSRYPISGPRRRYSFRPLGPYRRFYGRHIEG